MVLRTFEHKRKAVKFSDNYLVHWFGGSFTPNKQKEKKKPTMYCFSASFCFICLQQYPKNDLLDINKNHLKDTKLFDVLQFCGIDSNYCDDSYQVYMCESCVKKLVPFYEFKQECAKSFTKLRAYATQLKANANVAFHANLKVLLIDPKYGDCSNEPIEYMDVSQFLEAQIQTDETTTEMVETSPSEMVVETQPEQPSTPEIIETPTRLPQFPQLSQQQKEIINIMPQLNPMTNIQLYEISKFLYDNHFLQQMEPDYSEVIEIASSPESFNDIPQNSSGSFNDVPSVPVTAVVNKPLSRPQCTLCSKTFINQTHLSFHTFLHTLYTYPDTEASKSMKYYCVLCTVDISGLDDIKKHLLKHTCDKVFACEHCKTEFISYVDYNRHFSKFPEHKPFPCKLCERRFLTDYKLNVHTNKKHVLNCLFCSSCFKTKPELKAHMTDEHNNKYCYICSSSYSTINGLKKHLFDNHVDLQTTDADGKAQYNCSNCVRVFQTKYLLNEHLSKCVVG